MKNIITRNTTHSSSAAVGLLLWSHRRGNYLTALWIDPTWSYAGTAFVEILACYGEGPSKSVKIPKRELTTTLAAMADEVDHYYEVTDRSDREHGYPVTG